jgi:hypothetical protein
MLDHFTNLEKAEAAEREVKQRQRVYIRLPFPHAPRARGRAAMSCRGWTLIILPIALWAVVFIAVWWLVR